MATVTIEVPDDYPLDQVNVIATDAAAKLAAIRGMNAERVLTPGPLRYRLIECQVPPAPKPHANVVPLFRKPAPSRRFFPDFTPPSAA